MRILNVKIIAMCIFGVIHLTPYYSKETPRLRVFHQPDKPPPYIVELFLVISKSYSQIFENNILKILRRVEEIFKTVNSLFIPLNIVVILVHVEFWSNDIINFTNEDDLIKNLKEFRPSITNVRYDCLHVLLDSENKSRVVLGKGEIKRMCDPNKCVGVTWDSPEYNVTKTASTLTHELGHNFGLNHDSNDCDCDKCIMSEKNSKISDKQWSKCSIRNMTTLLAQRISVCLHDMPYSVHLTFPPSYKPSLHEMVVFEYKNSDLQQIQLSELQTKLNNDLTTCGNRILDPGEECDCGTEKTCPNEIKACCDPKSCKYRPGSECASGPCCQVVSFRPTTKNEPPFRCKYRAAGSPCRLAADSCDLSEFCDGKQEWCPLDYYKSDGEACKTIEGIQSSCIRGGCREPESWCKLLWGNTAQRAYKRCTLLNMRKKNTDDTNSIANCGNPASSLNNPGVPCANEIDAQCGRLWCVTNKEELMLSSYVTKSKVTNSRTNLKCHALLCNPLWSAYNHELPISDAYWGYRALIRQDAGMVPDGSACHNGVCFNGACISHDELPNRKTCNCSGNGVCNNLGHCHCNIGFAPPDCTAKGYGGSIDSGPTLQNNFNPILTTVLCIIFLLLLLGFCLVIYLQIRYKREHYVRLKSMLNLDNFGIHLQLRSRISKN